MNKTPDPHHFRNRRRSDLKRLESWKAIANYLNRSVRTVRRWEASENLPVHRLQHTKGHSVFAYCSELDAWRDSHQQSVQEGAIKRAKSAPRIGLLLPYAAIAILAAIIGALLNHTLFQDSRSLRSVDSGDVQWVLIADPENDSGRQELSDNLIATLHREIAKGQTHRMVPRERITRTLQFMRMDPDTTLTYEVAREVAIRDGNVSALIIPHIGHVGSDYFLGAEILEPNSDLSVVYSYEKISDLHSVLPSTSKFAYDVEKNLRMLPTATDVDLLPPVTTDSLSALRLYSQASELMLNSQPAAADRLLQTATDSDDEFSAALALRAWAMRQSGATSEEYLSLLRLAMNNNDAISTAEQYFVEGTYQHFVGEFADAAANYQALLEIRPDHVHGARAALELCIEIQSQFKCASEAVRVARLRPNHFDSNLQAAWSLASQAESEALAHSYAERALGSLSLYSQQPSPESISNALLVPVVTAWTSRDIERTAREIRRVQNELSRWSSDVQNYTAQRLGDIALSLGRVQDARILYDMVSAAARRQELQSRTYFALGDKDGLRSHLLAGLNYTDPLTALLMSMSGLPDKAAELFSNLQPGDISAAQSGVIRASLARANGDLAAAVQELEAVVGELTPADRGLFFVGPDMLAMALNNSGQSARAVDILERLGDHQTEAAYQGAGLFWMMCQHRLANFYRAAGRTDDADRVETRLRQMLELADEDFPLRRNLFATAAS